MDTTEKGEADKDIIFEIQRCNTLYSGRPVTIFLPSRQSQTKACLAKHCLTETFRNNAVGLS